MSFKPEIEKLLNDIFGRQKCICSFLQEESEDVNYDRKSADVSSNEGSEAVTNPLNLCPGCSVRDTLIYGIIGHLTGKIDREDLIKVFEYTSNAHPLKVATIFDQIYTWKEKADKISDEDFKQADKWAKVFGTEKNDKDDKGN